MGALKSVGAPPRDVSRGKRFLRARVYFARIIKIRDYLQSSWLRIAKNYSEPPENSRNTKQKL